LQKTNRAKHPARLYAQGDNAYSMFETWLLLHERQKMNVDRHAAHTMYILHELLVI